MLKMRSIGQMVQKLSFGQTDGQTDKQTDASETFTFLLSQTVIRIMKMIIRIIRRK